MFKKTTTTYIGYIQPAHLHVNKVCFVSMKVDTCCQRLSTAKIGVFKYKLMYFWWLVLNGNSWVHALFFFFFPFFFSFLFGLALPLESAYLFYKCPESTVWLLLGPPTSWRNILLVLLCTLAAQAGSEQFVLAPALRAALPCSSIQKGTLVWLCRPR